MSTDPTPAPAPGLFATALVQVLVQKDYVGAFQSLMAALGAIGLRHAMAKSG